MDPQKKLQAKIAALVQNLNNAHTLNNNKLLSMLTSGIIPPSKSTARKANASWVIKWLDELNSFHQWKLREIQQLKGRVSTKDKTPHEEVAAFKTALEEHDEKKIEQKQIYFQEQAKATHAEYIQAVQELINWLNSKVDEKWYVPQFLRSWIDRPEIKKEILALVGEEEWNRRVFNLISIYLISEKSIVPTPKTGGCFVERSLTYQLNKQLEHIEKVHKTLIWQMERLDIKISSVSWDEKIYHWQTEVEKVSKDYSEEKPVRQLTEEEIRWEQLRASTPKSLDWSAEEVEEDSDDEINEKDVVYQFAAINPYEALEI